MPEAFRRHDLVWLDAASASQCEVGGAERHHLERWLKRGLPLVVGRRAAGTEKLQLGFTLPGTERRKRVAVQVPRVLAQVRRPAPPLKDMLSHAPSGWRTRLAGLIEDLEAVGILPRSYGSLVTQSFCGEPCLRPDSDVDVLVDCRDRAQALAALSILIRHEKGEPRIDGELRIIGGLAAAWRELARSLREGGVVLAKSESGVGLVQPDEFFDACGTIPASSHASPGAAA